MSKEKIYDEALELEKIDKALDDLDIFDVDKFVSNFYNTNREYYSKHSDKISVIQNKGFSMTTKDQSKFNLEFIPSYISPSKIIMELSNLNGNSIKKVIVVLGEEMKVMYQTTITDEIKDSKKIHKADVEVNYKNGKKSYKKISELLVDEIECKDYSREETIYYPDLDDCYVKSIISIGTANSLYPTSVKYLKGNLESSIEITNLEFNSSIKYTKNKVLEKVCK